MIEMEIRQYKSVNVRTEIGDRDMVAVMVMRGINSQLDPRPAYKGSGTPRANSGGCREK